MSQSFSNRFSRRKVGAAFTLVELLVVIGIIAILISTLLPTLAKAREAGNQVKCLANMRSITQAMISFANDKKGLMPGRAGTGNTRWVSNGLGIASGTPAAGPKEAADWISWGRKIDPVTGATSTGYDGNITYSSIAPYIGVKQVDHGTDTALANNVAKQIESLFRCPSDDLNMRPNAASSGTNAYRYSYGANDWYMNPIQNPFATGFAPNARYGGSTFTGKITSIKVPSEKLLLVCMDELTLSDGIFKATPANWATGKVNMVASRHQKRTAAARNNAVGTPWTINEDAKGNVAFADGHAEFFGRKDALRAKYNGRPDPDPTGF